MTDDELSLILTNGGQLPVPYFGGEVLRVEPCDDDVRPGAIGALRAFLGLTADQRRSDARHLVAYCLLMMDVVDEEEILEEMNGEMPTLEGIWEHAEPTHLFVTALGQTTFVQLEGRVAWEPEHGLQMSWANGSRLVKVGPFDGHPTNGHATADPANDRYVFRCYDPDLCTLPDP